MEGSSLRRGRRSARGRLRAVDALTLAAVALVVLLVSLPRLKDLALRENEADAAWLTRRLAELCEGDQGSDVRALIEGAPRVGRQVDDAEFLEGGRVLRRHGYLFEVLALPAAQEGEPPAPAVRAWPWQAGRTGRAVLVWTPRTGLIGHPNQEQAWSGRRPPALEGLAASGWRRVRE